MEIRDRIKELRKVKASELLPNPKNWRKHPDAQANALRGTLSEIGYADALIAYETPNGLMLIDGHLRAETTPEMEVPVLVTDLTEDEADTLLATLDPLSAMARTDEDALLELVSSLNIQNDAVNLMLEAVANGERLLMPELTGYPELAEGDKSDIGQITFTVTEAQREDIMAALARAKREGVFADTGNENGNGNALGRICDAYSNR